MDFDAEAHRVVADAVGPRPEECDLASWLIATAIWRREVAAAMQAAYEEGARQGSAGIGLGPEADMAKPDVTGVAETALALLPFFRGNSRPWLDLDSDKTAQTRFAAFVNEVRALAEAAGEGS